MTKNQALTKQQKAQIEVFRDKWIKIGLSTETTDRQAANAAIRLVYECAGLDPPKIIIWFDSPYAMCLGKPIALRALGAKDQEATGKPHECIFGSMQAWLSFYDFFDSLGIVTGIEKIRGLIELAQHCGWILPMRDVCLASPRPSKLLRDDEHRLHCEDGPALSYPDGWSIYAWHGVRVPQRVIEAPDSLTAAEIRDEQNAEIRRVMLERFGQDRYLQEIGGKMIHEDDFGKLWHVDLKDDEPLRMVEVLNSTPEPNGERKTYFLRVPPGIETAWQAVAWTFGVGASEYRPEIES